ncbi:uncharacterized protein LOC143570979 [Bidens hawaiensis]|uniref:uncharacterized protein LOC143570979 n=1 Tax=Bidens hawaiensis TaxID=980011 RepID=UPI00404B0536
MEFQGDTQVKAVKLQGLRRDFENLVMKETELVGEYFSRVMTIVSQKRAYGEVVADQTIVEKIPRSLSPKFDYVVPSIEVSLDLSTLSPIKLIGSLQSQEERINSRSTPEKGEKSDEPALHVFQENNQQARIDNSGVSRDREGGPFRGRGHGRVFDISKIPQCLHCNKNGHMKKDCWFNEEPHANVAVEENENGDKNEEHLFMAIISQTEDACLFITHTKSTGDTHNLWFIDSGCSNHMTGSRTSFTQLDESFKLEVQLGDKKKLAIEGKGTVRIDTGKGGYKLLNDV